MNAIIGEMLAQHYIGLPFITKAAGCVHEIIKPSKKGSGRIPVATHVYQQEGDGVKCPTGKQYHDVAPSSSETGIVYFEDMGARATSKAGRQTAWQGKLRLVCWLNMKKIGEDNAIGDIMLNLIQHCPEHLAEQGKFLGGCVEVGSTPPKRPSPFEKYDYDEKATQFLMYPYQHHTLIIDWYCHVAQGCPTNVIINPLQC